GTGPRDRPHAPGRLPRCHGALELRLEPLLPEKVGPALVRVIALGQRTDEIVVVEPEARRTKTVQLRQAAPELLVEITLLPPWRDQLEHQKSDPALAAARD